MGIIASVLHKITEYAEQFSPIVICQRVLSVIFAKFLKGKILGGNTEVNKDGVLRWLFEWPPPTVFKLAQF